MDCVAASSADVMQVLDVLLWAVCAAVIVSHIAGALFSEFVREIKLAWQECQRKRVGF